MAPMELRAGIVAGHWMGLAARQVSVVVAHVTPQEGEGGVSGEWGGWESRLSGGGGVGRSRPVMLRGSCWRRCTLAGCHNRTRRR